ncbi:MAG TPA: hypothetical protein VF457_00400 [Burkholderiaceae bacterium]
MIRIRRPTGDSTKDQPVRLLWVLGWSLAGLLMVGCEPTHSSASNDDGESMFFGLFKTKSPSNVNPQIGAALVREASFPRGEGAQPQPDYPAVRRASLTAPPPQGRISSTAIEQASANAYITRELPGASVLVNVYEPERRCELWKIDGEDTTRLSHQQSLRFEADQSRWIMYGAGDAIALPGERLLVQLRYFNPSPTDRAYVIDMQSGSVRSLGAIQPDWPAGLPFHYLDSLQLKSDTLLTIYRTDQIRMRAEHYVNRYDHLLLFSPRHPDGLEVARIGIDDGNVRAWRFVGQKLWLQTSDERGSPPKKYNWSLDLSRIL